MMNVIAALRIHWCYLYLFTWNCWQQLLLLLLFSIIISRYRFRYLRRRRRRFFRIIMDGDIINGSFCFGGSRSDHRVY
jgi:hypothetical protein